MYAEKSTATRLDNSLALMLSKIYGSGGDGGGKWNGKEG